MKTMKSIDLKSFLIGLLVSICVILFVGSAQPKNNDKNRYQIVDAGATGVFSYVLDTYTGSVVQISFGTKSIDSGKGKAYITGKEIRQMLEKED